MNRALLVLAACGGHAHPAADIATVPPRPVAITDRILALLPEGAQVIVEVDLARLRANPVVGEVAKQALAQLGADARLPGLPVAVQGSPLAAADAIVLAAYGVGTDQAATVIVLAAKGDVAGATRLSPELVALGPDDWVGQLQVRATLTGLSTPEAVRRLRDHAMPPGATGAVLRVTARLPFDARIALARQTGLDAAPAQLSVWADVADDFAMIVDADAVDPGDKAGKDAARHLVATIRGALETAADTSSIRSLGVPTSLTGARLVAQGTWVRTTIAIGPRHLARVIERARAMLAPAS